MNIICPICNKEFKDRKGVSAHISRTHNIYGLEQEKIVVTILFGEEYVNSLVQDYTDEKYCCDNLPVDIIKYLKLLGLKRTNQEEKLTKRYKDSYIQSIREKYNDPNIVNVSQVKSIAKKISKASKNNYEETQHYRDEGYNNYIGTEKHKKTIQKIKDKCVEKYGHENFGAGEEAKKKRMASQRKNIDSWDYEERLKRTNKARESVCHRGGYSSKPEKRVRKVLIDLDIDFIPNKHMWNYNWDMVFDNIIIEVQGTMWHAKPDRYVETDLIIGKILVKDIWKKDERKRLTADKNNYILIEIWEDEIGARNDDDLLEFVRLKLNEVGYEC